MTAKIKQTFSTSKQIQATFHENSLNWPILAILISVEDLRGGSPVGDLFGGVSSWNTEGWRSKVWSSEEGMFKEFMWGVTLIILTCWLSGSIAWLVKPLWRHSKKLWCNNHNKQVVEFFMSVLSVHLVILEILHAKMDL